ncbi:hypothetical protein CsSME_00039842 [Camellia sinensis var. sinensis]
MAARLFGFQGHANLMEKLYVGHELIISKFLLPLCHLSLFEEAHVRGFFQLLGVLI